MSASLCLIFQMPSAFSHKSYLLVALHKDKSCMVPADVQFTGVLISP